MRLLGGINMSSEKTNSRGRPREISDTELKNIALEIKNKFRGQRITYKFLERETGIGRQTWKRRIEDYIYEINKPIFINSDASLENVYFPNIEQMFEKHKNDKRSLINELYDFEEMYRQLHQEVMSLRKKVELFQSLQQQVKNQELELDQVKINAANYEKLYKEAILNSGFSHLREQKGIKKNLIQFDSLVESHTTLEPKEISKVFPQRDDSNNSLRDDFASLYPDLFKDE